MDHAAILPPDALPTFNSHAIESALHKVPDLAEHFVYLNDDFFLGRPLGPETFFTPAGLAAVWLSPNSIGLDETPDAAPYLKAAWNNRRLLQEAFGAVVTDNLAHAPYPHRRSVLEEIERRFPDEVARTARSPFRSDTDLSMLSSFAQHFGLLTGTSYVARILTSRAGLHQHQQQRPRVAAEEGPRARSRTSSAWPTTTTTHSTRSASNGPSPSSCPRTSLWPRRGSAGGDLDHLATVRGSLWTFCYRTLERLWSRRALRVPPSAYRSYVGSPRVADLGEPIHVHSGGSARIDQPSSKGPPCEVSGDTEQGACRGTSRRVLSQRVPVQVLVGMHRAGPFAFRAGRSSGQLGPIQLPSASQCSSTFLLGCTRGGSPGIFG